jgi:hypothetical protein
MPSIALLPMSRLRVQPVHLGDAIAYLIAHGDGIVNHISAAQLVSLQRPAEHGPLDLNIPLYHFVKVYLESSLFPDNGPVYLGFVNNGLLPFADGEGLGPYVLDELDYYTAIQLPSEAWLHAPLSVRLDTAGEPLKSFQLFYPSIMEDFSLDGSGDLAGFVGVFLVD